MFHNVSSPVLLNRPTHALFSFSITHGGLVTNYERTEQDETTSNMLPPGESCVVCTPTKDVADSVRQRYQSHPNESVDLFWCEWHDWETIDERILQILKLIPSGAPTAAKVVPKKNNHPGNKPSASSGRAAAHGVGGIVAKETTVSHSVFIATLPTLRVSMVIRYCGKAVGVQGSFGAR